MVVNSFISILKANFITITYFKHIDFVSVQVKITKYYFVRTNEPSVTIIIAKLNH